MYESHTKNVTYLAYCCFHVITIKCLSQKVKKLIKMECKVFYLNKIRGVLHFQNMPFSFTNKIVTNLICASNKNYDQLSC